MTKHDAEKEHARLLAQRIENATTAARVAAASKSSPTAKARQQLQKLTAERDALHAELGKRLAEKASQIQHENPHVPLSTAYINAGKAWDPLMKTTSETPQEIIGRLETELSRIVASRAEMILAIDARLKTAEQVIVDVNERPGPDKIQAGLDAHSEIQFLAKLRESIAEQYLANPMKMLRSRDRWLQDHHAELSDAIGAILDEKAAGRDAYLESSAVRQGQLTAAAVRAQGTPGEAAADDALAQEEALLFDAEQCLANARTQLRALQTDRTYAGWIRAREAVKLVSFEISEVCALETAGVSAP